VVFATEIAWPGDGDVFSLTITEFVAFVRAHVLPVIDENEK
jgi:hypothetical protein